MMMAPAVALPLKLAVAIRPTIPVLLVDRVFSDSFRTLGGTTMAYASLSDLFTGAELTASLSRLNMATGLGIVVAPLAASAITSGGQPRRAFAFASVLAAIHLVLGNLLLKETLACQERDPSHTSKHPNKTGQKQLLQPVWHFLRLFTTSCRLRMRACLFGLHCLVEGKVLQDQVSLLQLSNGWDMVERSRWTSGLGMAILIGGASSGLIKRLGEHGFTSLCHLASLLAFSTLRKGWFWVCLVCLCLGQQRRSASSSWVLAEASGAGVGRGEIVGWTASLRSVAEAVSAVMYAAAYRAAASKGQPSNSCWLPCALTLAAEVQRVRISWGDRVPGANK